MKLVICSLVLAVAACASTHDPSHGANYLGGSLQHTEIKPGFFSIRARTNFGPWSNHSGAKSAWTSKADSLCGATKYRELGIRESVNEIGQPMGIFKYLVTERSGYALCNDATTSFEEATALSK
jgi:hypothetical protein